jgi:hypothetical protein
LQDKAKSKATKMKSNNLGLNRNKKAKKNITY